MAVDPVALALGLAPGLTLADARARVPALAVADLDPAADHRLLERLADDADRWSPLVALDPPHGLLLDITGCAHLRGGEKALRHVMGERLHRHGLTPRIAIAGTPDCARALARFGRRPGVVPPGCEADAVRSLPIAALELPEEAATALTRAGLKTIGQLAERPTLPFTARFGDALTAKLRRVLGREDRRLVSRRPVPLCLAERRFPEPLTQAEGLEAVIAGLLDEIAPVLEARGEGGRVFEACFFRVDGVVRRVVVETGRPTRAPTPILRLYRERVDAMADPLDPGFGFDLVRLAVLHAEKLSPAQASLDGRAAGEAEIGALVDRLAARFGRERVLRFAAEDTHDPDRAVRLVPATEAASPTHFPAPEPEEPPARPLRLFDPPHPIDAIAAQIPEGPPGRFRWRKRAYDVVRAEGPERIEPEWWRSEGQQARDYYRIEDQAGRRFWIFRTGFYDGGETPRWFLHGLFP
jgi:protein ImuB